MKFLMAKFLTAVLCLFSFGSAHALSTYPTGHWTGTGTQTTNGVTVTHTLDLSISASQYTAVYSNTEGSRRCEYQIDYSCNSNGICTYTQAGVQTGTGYCVGNHCSMTGAWINSCQAPVAGTMNLSFNADGSVDRFGANGPAPTLLMDHSIAAP